MVGVSGYRSFADGDGSRRQTKRLTAGLNGRQPFMNSITQLRHELDRVAGRFRAARLWTGLAVCWLAGGLASLAVANVASAGQRLPALGAVVLTTALAAGLWAVL